MPVETERVDESSWMQTDEGQDEHDSLEDVDSATNQKLSCQQCRGRKVKCDRKDPCTQCVRKKVGCIYPSGFKPRQKRQKVLVSPSYEDKIDDLSKKMTKLCQIFDNHHTPSGEKWLPSSGTTPIATPNSSAPSVTTRAFDTSSIVNEPTLAAETAFATNYARRVFNHSIVSDELAQSLERLNQMITDDKSNSVSVPKKDVVEETSANLDDMRLPRMELAILCLQQFRESDSLMFYWTWDIDTVGQLLETTLAAYTSKPSRAELIIVNSTLFRVFEACVLSESLASAHEELETQAWLCEANLKLLISKLPFDLAPSFDNILAIYHVTTYLMSQGKTMAAWRHVASAIQMCQILGFHRERPLVPETAQQRRRRIRLMWMLIIVDKTLSFRLGLSSSIRDHDLTLEKPLDTAQDDVCAFSFLALLPKWIDVALLQGKVYEEIYSPAALLLPESIRVARARALATDMQRAFESTSTTESQVLELRKRALGEEMHDLFQRADRINHLATLTLIYRAIPGGAYSGSVFSEECVVTAQEALTEHKKCLSVLKRVQGPIIEMYIQWAILSSPFTPFIVLFCRSFETPNAAHLDMMASVVETLDLLPPELPRVYRIQLKVFKAMYEVAREFVNTNNTRPPDSHGMTAPSFTSFEGLENILDTSGTSAEHSYTQGGNHSMMITAPNTHGTACTSVGSMDITTHMGSSGAELGTWFDQNQRMFTTLQNMF